MPDEISPAANTSARTAHTRIWTRDGFRVDSWQRLEDGEPLPTAGAVILSLARWRNERDGIDAAGALQVGVELSTNEEIAPAVDALHRLGIIILPFPKFTDGRSYSTARRLREQGGYRGELRASGDVLFDQLPLMAACGFDSFAIAHAGTIARLQRAPLHMPDRMRRRLPYIVASGHPSGHADIARATSSDNPVIVYPSRPNEHQESGPDQMSYFAYISATNHDNDVLAARIAAAGSLEERIVLIGDNASGRVAFSTSLGIEDQAILHAIATTRTPIDVFTLDTGRLFAETIDTIAESERRYGISIRVVAPDAAELERLVARDGVHGFRFSVGARKSCCEVRKVNPLRRALSGAAVWITGLRREQSGTRDTLRFTARDGEFGLLKANPLADWSLERLQAYVSDNGVPVNPLHARGFPSIGCQPCTRAVLPGEHIRSGRWWWESPEHKECGLHVVRQPAEAAE